MITVVVNAISWFGRKETWVHSFNNHTDSDSYILGLREMAKLTGCNIKIKVNGKVV